MFIAAKHWRDAVVIFCELRLRKLQFKFRKHLDGDSDFPSTLSNLARHLQQNAMHLSQFVFQQAYQFVVLLDRLQWLYENCLAAGTCPMHHALHASFVFSLDRNNEAFTPHCHSFPLLGSALAQPPQITLEGLLYGSSLFLNFTPYACQFR